MFSRRLTVRYQSSVTQSVITGCVSGVVWGVQSHQNLTFMWSRELKSAVLRHKEHLKLFGSRELLTLCTT